MREAIGATWIFTICLTFIILMTAYLAISVNYAKAFKIKSYIVTSIEENNGKGYTTELGNEIETYLTAQGYAAKGPCPLYLKTDGLTTWKRIDSLQQDGYDEDVCGVGIYSSPVNTDNDDIDAERYYYKVIAFFKFDLPIVNFLTTFQVSGETRYVYDMLEGGGAPARVTTRPAGATRRPTTTSSTTRTTTTRPTTSTTTRVRVTRSSTTAAPTTTRPPREIDIHWFATEQARNLRAWSYIYTCNGRENCFLDADSKKEFAGKVCAKAFETYEKDIYDGKVKLIWNVYGRSVEVNTHRECLEYLEIEVPLPSPVPWDMLF